MKQFATALRSRRAFFNSIFAAGLLISLPAYAETDLSDFPDLNVDNIQNASTEEGSTLGHYWPKFDGAYLRLKDGSLVDLPKLEEVTYDPNADVFHLFQMRGKPQNHTYQVRGLLIDPNLMEKVPVVDGSQIEAFVFKASSFDRLTTIHRVDEYFNDPSRTVWEPIKRFHVMQSDGKAMDLPQDWTSLLVHSDWGQDDDDFRVERGPDRSKAFHLGKTDITKWINGRWMEGGWKQGDPQDVPVRAFVLNHGFANSRGRADYSVFRIEQQPLN